MTCLCAYTCYFWLPLIYEADVLGIKILVSVAVCEPPLLAEAAGCWEVVMDEIIVTDEIRVPAHHWLTVCSGSQIRKTAVPVQCEYCCDRNTSAALSCFSSFFKGLFSLV